MSTVAMVATIMEESISKVEEPAAAAAAEGAPEEEEVVPPEEAGTAIRRSTANKSLETSKPSLLFLAQCLLNCWFVVYFAFQFSPTKPPIIMS
jgi:hypothetical protein